MRCKWRLGAVLRGTLAVTQEIVVCSWTCAGHPSLNRLSPLNFCGTVVTTQWKHLPFRSI